MSTNDFTNDAKSKLDDIKIYSYVTPIYDKYVGYYVKSDGIRGSLSGFSMSNPIKIPSGVTRIFVNGLPKHDYLSAVAFYNTDDIAGLTAMSKYICKQDLTQNVYIDVPDGATYMFISKQDSYPKYSTAKYCFIYDILVLADNVDKIGTNVNNYDTASNIVFGSCTEVATEIPGLYGDITTAFTTSVFSGWKVKGIVFDTDKTFNSITIPIMARDNAITKVNFCVTVNGVQTIKSVTTNIEANSIQNITCEFDNTFNIKSGESVEIGYACNKYCNMVGKSQANNLYRLDYKTEGSDDVTYWAPSNSWNCIPSICINELKLSQSETPSTSENKMKLHLPKKYDLVVGDSFELFYKGIFNALNPDIFDFEISFGSGNYGKGFKRKYTWTPTSSNIGQHTMTIKVRNDNGDLVDTGSVILNVVGQPTSPSENKVVLCVGDSLTVGGDWCAEFYRRLMATDGSPVGYGLNNIQFIGERTKNGANYVGEGGWKFNFYNTKYADGKSYYIYGTFNKTDDDQHSVYSDTVGNTWKLETITSDMIKIILVDGTANSLPSTGTLSHVSGGSNVENIVYTSSKLEAGNPFWNNDTDKVDFAWYAEQKGVSSIDYCFVLLGWNSTGESESSYKALVREFLDNLLFAFPDCKVSLMGLQVPSRDGLAQNYGVSWKYYSTLRAMWNISKWYQDVSEEEPYSSNVEYVNVSGQFDTDNNMQTTSVAVNNRNSKTEKRQSNGVHPSVEGYLQIADVALRNFVAKL